MPRETARDCLGSASTRAERPVRLGHYVIDVRANANVKSDRNAVLSIRDLSKRFVGQVALRDVSFDVKSAEVHALVGQNGSGKSTLIKVLSGYHLPDAGATVLVAGEPLQFGDPKASARVGLRFVHQDLGLVPTMDTVENFALATGYETGLGGHIRWRRQVTRARHGIQTLGYDFDVRRLVRTLTQAERTGVAIARALEDPAAGARESSEVLEGRIRVLLLDEPTAAMPRPDVARLFEVLAEIRSRGIAIIYVTHHLEEVFEVADRISVLRDGALVATHEAGGLDHDHLVDLLVSEEGLKPVRSQRRVEIQGTRDRAVTAGGEVILTAEGLTGRSMRGVSFSVRRGEVLGIAGLDGSGREEIAPALFGGRSRGGQVVMDNIELPSLRPDIALARGMGYVPADRLNDALVPTFLVRENLTLNRLRDFWRGAHLSRRQERVEASRWLDTLAVRPKNGEAPINALSGGNKQKVVLAKWLRLDPRLFILDEPTHGVDVGGKTEIHGLIDGMAERGITVIVCASDTNELVRLCTRVLILRRGAIRAELTGRDIDEERIDTLCLQVDERPELRDRAGQ